MWTSPQIACPELPAFDKANLGAVLHAFQAAPGCRLQQLWLAETEPGFTPTMVQAGWRNDALLLLAELKDADIFTFARHTNERLWELGDALEVFLRPADQPAYAEFQIAPNNQRTQLRFADAAHAEFARKTGSFDTALVHKPAFDSHTWVRTGINCWYALLEIPAASVSDNPAPLPGSEWLFSFCRYDYTRGCPAPVISSTSAHSRPDFHRQEEWGKMRFQPRRTNYEQVHIASLAGQPG
jgi:hypothetical protein